MTMDKPYFFDANEMEWRPHPRFPTILTKSFETRASYPDASVTLVQVGVTGVIETHVHEVETETAYVISGRGRLLLGDNEQILQAGTGITIPPGLPHSLHNTEDEPMELFAVHIPPVF
ncbi:MAG: cupin domain-containing protein [Anaerolineales bacterium]|jgi:mannose-6-phosphate isomerase-like protein (cupin superfamily)|nr:cupin domain-containing protein [Anaerolineales bacterium]|tara:strand:+ start:12179 stop:12532 length:354 start_codon:yes stop_codon:yes gene_type:complete